MKEKIIISISILLITLFGAGFVLSKYNENKDINEYYTGLKNYKTKNYKTAYKHFGKVSIFSNIKSAALFRQARCASMLGDISGAKRNYTILLTLYPKSDLYVISEYNLAALLFQNENKTARRYFSHIIKYYPKTDYALASEYYIASMDMQDAEKSKIYLKRKRLKRNSLKRFIKYIDKSPDGRYAQSTCENIIRLGIALSKEDNLILANSYYKRGDFEKAKEYYAISPIERAWPMMAKTEYKSGNNDKANSIIKNGLLNYSETVSQKDMEESLDEYFNQTKNKSDSVNDLIKNCPNTSCMDYLLYIKAQNSSPEISTNLYEEIYKKYPESEYAPDSLYKVFYKNITEKKYDEAIRLGHKHLKQYKDSDTAAAVHFWLGKIYEKRNSPISAKYYYLSAVNAYPDSYYSYRSYAKIKKNTQQKRHKIRDTKISFPCKDKDERNMASKLLMLGDYDFILELYKENPFTESWVEYQKGNFAYSAILAEKSMKKIYPKPKFNDIRWKLVYPIHYIEYIERYKGNQDSLLILSIIREESHFNPEIISPVGAVGLMQLMPATANELSSLNGYDNNLLNPETNIRLGSLYYSNIKNSLENEDIYAIMAYNGGQSNVINWLTTIEHEDIDDLVEKIPFNETQSYLKKVLRSYWCYLNIYN